MSKQSAILNAVVGGTISLACDSVRKTPAPNDIAHSFGVSINALAYVKDTKRSYVKQWIDQAVII